MAAIRKAVGRILQFLSHPAWNGVSCFIAVILAFGLTGAITAAVLAAMKRLQGLFSLLQQPVTLSVGSLVLVSVLVIGMLLTALRTILLKASESIPSVDDVSSGDPCPQGYSQYWKVCWKTPYNMWDGIRVIGPFCPEHLLELKVATSAGRYEFTCPGPEGGSSHLIYGPEEDELIPPEDRRYRNEADLLQYDVAERAVAALRRAGKL
jgi:hypothetical protein